MKPAGSTFSPLIAGLPSKEQFLDQNSTNGRRARTSLKGRATGTIPAWRLAARTAGPRRPDLSDGGQGRSGQGELTRTAVILEPARPADLSPLVLDLHGLTNREREITQLLLRGLPTRQIAAALFISRHTLSDHMKAIFAKLGVTSRPELAALLLDHAPAASPR